MTSVKRSKRNAASLLDDLASDYAPAVATTTTKNPHSAKPSSSASSASSSSSNTVPSKKQNKDDNHASRTSDNGPLTLLESRTFDGGISSSAYGHPNTMPTTISSRPTGSLTLPYDEEDTGVAIGLSTDSQSTALLKMIGKKRSRSHNLPSNNPSQNLRNIPSTTGSTTTNPVTVMMDTNASNDEQAQIILDRLGPLVSSIYTYARNSSSVDNLTLLTKMNKNIQLETYKNELNLANIHQQLVNQQKKSEALLSQKKKKSKKVSKDPASSSSAPSSPKLDAWKRWRNGQYNGAKQDKKELFTAETNNAQSSTIKPSFHPLVSATNSSLLTTIANVFHKPAASVTASSSTNAAATTPNHNHNSSSSSLSITAIPPHYFTNEQINTFHRLHRDVHGWLETPESVRLLYNRWWKETYALTVRLSSAGQVGTSTNNHNHGNSNNNSKSSTMVSLADMQTAFRLEEKARRNASNPQLAAVTAQRNEQKELKLFQKAEKELPLSLQHHQITIAILKHNLVASVTNWKGVWIHINRCKVSRGNNVYGYVTWIGQNNFTLLQYFGPNKFHTKGYYKPCTLPKQGTWWIVRWPNTLQVPKGSSIDNFRETNGENGGSSLGGNEYLVEIACEGLPKNE